MYNSELELISNTDNVYEFGFEANGKLIEEQESRIKEITEIYGKYVVNYESFAKLSPYILPYHMHTHTCPEYQGLIYG